MSPSGRHYLMSLLKQIDDKGAVLEWSPVRGKPNLVALGTKVSSSTLCCDMLQEISRTSSDTPVIHAIAWMILSIHNG